MASDAFRLTWSECRDLLVQRLTESAPGLIQLLSGPRQVGKTTLLLELRDMLGPAAIYAAADGPEAAVPGFWERTWARAEATASTEGRAVVLLDEAHQLDDWAGRLKGEWDRLRRGGHPVHVIATGSSALRLGSGSREDLTGRFERITLTHWPARSLADAFGIERRAAADLLVRMGSYPGSFGLRNDIQRWTAYVRDSIVEPAIGRDILALGAVRKPALLRQVFAVCALSPAQIVSLQKMQGRLQDGGALETIAHYLDLLEEAFLVVPVAKHTVRPIRRRSAPPKLVVLSNAIPAVVDPRGIPQPASDPARFGAWVENACLAHAWNAGQRVSYWREEPYEVDAVLEGTWGSWAIEVKTGPVAAADFRGVAEFTRRFPAFRPLVLCNPADRLTVTRLGLEALDWVDFLVDGPPGIPATHRRP